MALTSTIITDTSLSTVVLTIKQASTTIEQITYQDSVVETFTFNHRPSFSVSFDDFPIMVTLMDQFYNTAVKIYNVNQNAVSPITNLSLSIVSTPPNVNSSMSNQGHDLFNFSSDTSTKITSVAARSNSPKNTTTLAEWIYLLFQVKYYTHILQMN